MAAADAAAERGWRGCTAEACRGAAAGPHDRCLAHLDDDDVTGWLSRFGRGRTLDARGTVLSGTLLRRVLEAAPLAPDGRRRIFGARFDGATFETDATFDGISFGREASFDGARFLGGASFVGAVFTSSARFAQASVAGAATFDGAVFRMDAWFAGASFSGDASFQDARFTGPARFADATFHADARFDRAAFSSHAWFEGAVFGCHAEFPDGVFEDDARFTRVHFTRPARFHGAAFKGREGIPLVAAVRNVTWPGPPLAPWGRRAVAALLDQAVPSAFSAGGILVALAFAWLNQGEFVPFCLLGGWLLALRYTLRNLADQGRSGQTMGKRRTGLRLLRERDRRPVGVGASIGRQLLHAVDTLPLFLGWLWPLRDEKHRTFADAILGTVVVVVGEHWHRVQEAEDPAAAAVPAGFG